MDMNLDLSRRLHIEPLTPQAFAPFGDLIAPRDDAQRFFINGGQAERFHGLAMPEAEDGGRVGVSVVRCAPCPLPMKLRLLERHRLGSQAFVPLGREAFLVVVAPGGDMPDLAGLRCFLATGGQGVQYRRGTWHHPLLAMDVVTEFVVIDRIGGGEDCDEWSLAEHDAWIAEGGALGSRF